MEFRYDYLKCQSCENRNLCDLCEADLMEKLLLEQEIRYVNFQMPDKTLSVTSDLELRKLEELFQKYGVVVH